MRSEICRLAIAAALMILPIITAVCQAESARTIIIFPRINAPVQRIYDTIIEGIQKTLPQSTPLSLDRSLQPAEVESAIRPFNPDKIIVLGRTTAEKVALSDYRDKMVVAGVLFEPDEYSGISLAIDSRRLLQEIKTTLPSIKRVFVVGSPRQPNIRIYPESLQGQPLIVPQIHEDPLINSRQLWQLLEQATHNTDAIILPSHLDRDILYELVQLAWRKKIILLSTNLAHLKEGVLMVFYPDNAGMGRQIGDFATQHSGPGFESLTHIQIALNPTVAKHLGLKFAPDALKRFKLQVK